MLLVLWRTTCSFAFSTIHRRILRVNVPDSAGTTLGHTSRKAALPERPQAISKPGLHVSASGASCSSPGARSELHGRTAAWWGLGRCRAEKSGHLCLLTCSISIARSHQLRPAFAKTGERCWTRARPARVVSGSSRRGSRRTLGPSLSRVSGRER